MARGSRLFGDLGVTPVRYESSLRDADQSRLKGSLGLAAFDAAYSAGQGLSNQEITDLALHATP
jgi:hypothetical protein